MVMNSIVEPGIFAKLMNCVFVLESREIILDVLDMIIDREDPEGQTNAGSKQAQTASQLSKQDYLKQATQKTKGVYIPVKIPTKGLIQYVLQSLVMSKAQRDTYKMPYLTATRFSGTCNCHNQNVELAYVCSACLAIYCERGRSGICDFCHEKYDLVNFNQVMRPLNTLSG